MCHELLYLFATDGSVVPTVHLRADGDGKTAGELIDYLRRRALACRILLAADDQMSAETVAALCAMSGDGVTVRPEIVIGDSDSRRNLYARLCRLSALYPMSRWRFGGRATDSLLFFAAHRHFERVMNRLLHEEESK